MAGQTDRASLLGHRPPDGLADPPVGVRRKPEPLAPVIAVDRLVQADVALLHQVEEAQAAAEILLGHRDDQPQVGLDQPLARSLTHLPARVALLRELDLLLGSQQRRPTDLAKVQGCRVAAAELLSGRRALTRLAEGVGSIVRESADLLPGVGFGLE